MDQRGRTRQDPSRATIVRLTLWTIVVCIISQIPYTLVWRGLSTFPYDAFTTFNPWFVGQLAELRAGEGLLSLYQDELPFDIWPSYFFVGFLRQMLFFLQANSASGHALVQALHAILLVPAVALLLRSFRIPWQYGVLGGLVFALSGIHVSLAHHVLAHEALLYLVLSLWALRELILGWMSQGRAGRTALFAFTGVITISLVRVHHEAILYLIPLACWALAHLLLLYRASGSRAAMKLVVVMAVLAVLVGIASVPMLVTAYEMSLVNKTMIASYDQLGPYFSDKRAFFLSLILPGFAGGTSRMLPMPFSFHQEATLSYVFFGTLTLPFLGVVLGSWWQSGRRRSALVVASTFLTLLGYTLGQGSPIHLVLCQMFPFLVSIGHNYYGFHLLYLLTAFAVAEGARIVVTERRVRLLAVLLWVQGSVISYFALQSVVAAGWGLDGSFAAFGRMLTRDVQWQSMLLVAMLAVLLVTRMPVRGATLSDRAGRLLGNHSGQWLPFLLIAGLIGADLLRPTLRAHFLPNPGWVAWVASPLGGFNPSVEIRAFLKAQQAHVERPLRIVPIFPRGGGWQANALMTTDMHLVGMPGDSGGNRYVEAWLSAEPQPTRIREFVDAFGVDAVWVSRWGVENWAEALRTAPGLRKVFSSPYGGDIYMRAANETAPPYIVANGVLQFPWNFTRQQAVVDHGVVTRTWRFSIPASQPSAADGTQVRAVRLPLMWHSGYGVQLADGRETRYLRDNDGRLMVPISNQSVGEIVVRYPSRPLAWLVVAAALVYGILVLTLLVAGAIRLREGVQRLRRRQTSGFESNE